MITSPSKVVLLVDDEANFFDIYAWKLEQFSDIKFIHAQSGHEAYALMRQQKVDVVISDINMPNGNGIWLLEKISLEYSEVPVIIASGNTEFEENVISLGASAFVCKTDLNILSLKFGHLV